MTYWNYLTKITTINKGLLNKKPKLKKKNLYGSFLWMGFNCPKASATLRRQFTFYHKVPRYSWYSFYWPQKNERLSRPWSHPVVLNKGPLDWESSAITTRPTLHHCGFNWKFRKRCCCDYYYQWNSSYWILEQYWVRWLCVHSSPVTKLLFHTKIDDSLLGIF